MPGLAEHDKIAKMAGIPDHISNEINRFIDDIDPAKEFEEHNIARKIFVCGHLNVSIRNLMNGEKLKDRGRKEWVVKEDLKWLLETKREYVVCYYLHFAVDSIYESRNLIKSSDEIKNHVADWQKKDAVVVTGSEPYLKEAVRFLHENAAYISQIIFHN